MLFNKTEENKENFLMTIYFGGLQLMLSTVYKLFTDIHIVRLMTTEGIYYTGHFIYEKYLCKKMFEIVTERM